jgi:hypothetical protein
MIKRKRTPIMSTAKIRITRTFVICCITSSNHGIIINVYELGKPSVTDDSGFSHDGDHTEGRFNKITVSIKILICGNCEWANIINPEKC